MSIGDPALAVMLGYSSPDGVTVSEGTAMTLSAVYRAVSLVAGSVATLPLASLQVQDDGRRLVVPSFLDNPGGDLLTPFEWKERVMLYLLLHGNVFLQHIYNGAGALSWLNVIHPRCVSVYADAARPGGKRFVVTIQESKDGATYAETVDLDGSSMTQIMGPSFDGLRGLSPIAAARLSLGTALAGDKAAYRTFANGALIAGMVTPQGDEELTEDEAKLVKETINRKVLGPENAGDIPVINRKLQFSPWQLSAVDAQFLESRTFSVDEVGRWFGVPPHLLGLTEKSTSWGQGIAEQNRGLARYTLTPWTTRIDERMTRLLPAGKSAEFDFSAFVKPSPEDEVNLLIQQVNSGLITPNEARADLNRPSLPDGDALRLPAGVLPPGVLPGGAPAGDTEPAESPQETPDAA